MRSPSAIRVITTAPTIGPHILRTPPMTSQTRM